MCEWLVHIRAVTFVSSPYCNVFFISLFIVYQNHLVLLDRKNLVYFSVPVNIKGQTRRSAHFLLAEETLSYT